MGLCTIEREYRIFNADASSQDTFAVTIQIDVVDPCFSVDSCVYPNNSALSYSLGSSDVSYLPASCVVYTSKSLPTANASICRMTSTMVSAAPAYDPDVVTFVDLWGEFTFTTPASGGTSSAAETV